MLKILSCISPYSIGNIIVIVQLLYKIFTKIERTIVTITTNIHQISSWNI
jgi:hypothetical protein